METVQEIKITDADTGKRQEFEPEIVAFCCEY